MFWQIIIFVLFVYLLYKYTQRNKDLPPGEFGWPIFGILPYLKGHVLRDYLDKVKTKYGNIYCVKVGSRLMVFLRNLETIKHFNRNELSGRPDAYEFEIFKAFMTGGITFNDGPSWEANRRFALRHLKEFGFGKSSKMQVLIQREVEEFIEGLKTKVGEPFEVDHSLNIALVNVIWGLTTGMRIDRNDQRSQEMVKEFYIIEKLAYGPMQLMTFLPILVTILPTFVKNKWMKVDQALQMRSKLCQFIREIVDDHKKTLDKSNPRDYIDAYLIEMEEKKELTNIEDHASNLVLSVSDFYIAGMETGYTTLKWFILLMATYPEVQTRVQQELDAFMPSNQIMPLLEHKSKFPFLQATIYEAMRYKTILPFSASHSALEECYVDGYRIPKDAFVISCLEDVHQDPQYWEKPDEFIPDRFLDHEGQLKAVPDAFMPFGYGKRLCLGEVAARMELFMFSGGILSNFNIRIPDGAQVNLNPDTSASFHFSFPHPYKIILEKRNSA